MDLLANYASSDEEEEEENPNPNFQSKPSLLSSLPNPKNNQFQKNPNSILPPPNPKNNQINEKPTSLLSSLPPPNPKRVIKINHPLIKPRVFDDSDDEDEIKKENEKEKEKKIFTKTPSFFSNIPAPKTQLGVSGLGSGSSRKSILDTNVLSLKEAQKNNVKFGGKSEKDIKFGEKSDIGSSSIFGKMGGDSNFVNYSEKSVLGSNLDSNLASFGEKSGLITSEYAQVGGDPNFVNFGEKSDIGSSLVNSEYNQVGYDPNNVNFGENLEYNQVGYDPNNVNYSGSSSINGNYDGNNVYANYDYSQYSNTWGDGYSETVNFGVGESVLKVAGKRGRSEIPTEIVEVKQDDLTKNRPREDQVKSTGIAFGPAYQPVSTKGKPSKLMKRKHQIGSLYFDMRQKESELAERRSKGFLTKAETQAKYGW